ncbi:nuclear factor 7, ovary-like [Halichoeres trimaculatus]|uniref:nuclear factor 7, ovary-like n=1 Tax=Halichoeres trimaculatus TaxID=147232 RepID=UPI003D9EF529
MASRLEEDLCCPICQDIFKDAVMLSCSHSFCRDCVQSWWRGKEDRECAVCKRRHSRGTLRPNFTLRNLCESFLLDQDQRPSEDLCSLHSEKLKLFCLDHQEPVCVVCRDSEKHATHGFRPIDEAAPQHRKKLLETLEPFKRKLEDFQRVKVNFDQIADHIQLLARHTESQIKEEFQKLHQFLEEEEEARLDTEEQLRAGDVSFLKNYKTTALRLQQRPLLEDHQLPSGALIHVAKHLGNLSFNVWKKMRDMAPYTPVILDSGSAHPDLTLSKDLTSMSRGPSQDVPDNPERINYNCSVLGSEGFASGTHSWEVEVGGSTDWSVGVFAESEHRKTQIQSGLWRIWFTGGSYKALCPTDADIILPVQTPFQRIRVNLDRNQGEILFSDPDTDTQIHTFILTYPHTLAGRMFPFFRNRDQHPLKISAAKVPVNVEKLMHEYDDDDDDDEDDVDVLNLMRNKKYTEIWGKIKR